MIKDCTFSLPKMDSVVEVPDLHPDTTPEAITLAQRAAVREALDALLARGDPATAENVSLEAVLPVSVVTRRLGEIRRRLVV